MSTQHDGDFRTFILDIESLSNPPSAERQIELARQDELSRDDFEELTGIRPEKNQVTGNFEIGLYVIDDNGIRPKWTREDILEWPVQERRLIQNQNLAFPCTPAALVDFLDRGGFDGSLYNLLPDAFRNMATVTSEQGTAEQLLWWETDYDIPDLAQEKGDQLQAKGERPSLNNVSNKVADHINTKEMVKAGLGGEARHVSATRLKKGPLKGWKYRA